MSTQSDLHDAVGPDSPAISREDHQLLEELVGIVDDLDTLEHEELVERFHEEHGNFTYGEGPDLEGWADQYEPAPLDLPSHGDYGQEDCGVEIPHICPDCGHSVEVGRTCSQSRCPRCWAAWVLKTAPGIVARIMSAAKMKDGAQYKHHVVVSPPEELYIDAEDPEEAFMDAVQQMMKAIDLDGIALYHGWTGDDAEGPVDEELEDDQGEWKYRIDEDRDWYGDVREELKERPHAHLIGATDHVPGGQTTKRLYEETGWILDRLTERNGSPISLRDERSVARALCYSLSHTAIDTRGERNVYVRRKNGSAYHKPTDDLEEAHPSHAENLRDAKQAVYDVAPHVLGVSLGEIECRNDVEAEDADSEHDVQDLIDDDPDGSESSSDSSESSTKIRKCGGDLCDIDKATDEDAEGPYIYDENWQRRADHADDALEAAQKWEEAGGWEGWTGQSKQLTLDAELAEVEGDPPPD